MKLDRCRYVLSDCVTWPAQVALDYDPPEEAPLLSTLPAHLIEISLKPTEGRVPPFKLTMERKAAVKDLKLRVVGVYPGQPNADDVRLVYGGKVLKDSQRLSKAFGRDRSLAPAVLVSVARRDDDGRYAHVVTDQRDYSLPRDDTYYFHWRGFLGKICWPCYYAIVGLLIVFTVLLALRVEGVIYINWYLVWLPLMVAGVAWVLYWYVLSKTLSEAGEDALAKAVLFALPLALAPLFVPMGLGGGGVAPVAGWSVAGAAVGAYIVLHPLALLWAMVRHHDLGIAGAVFAFVMGVVPLYLFWILLPLKATGTADFPWYGVFSPWMITFVLCIMGTFALIPEVPRLAVYLEFVWGALLAQGIMLYMRLDGKTDFSFARGVMVPAYVAELLLLLMWPFSRGIPSPLGEVI